MSSPQINSNKRWSEWPSSGMFSHEKQIAIRYLPDRAMTGHFGGWSSQDDVGAGRRQ